MQDELYFTGNCLTHLELAANSVVVTNERLKLFSETLKADNCYGQRADIVLCSSNPASFSPSNERVGRFEALGSCSQDPSGSCVLRPN